MIGRRRKREPDPEWEALYELLKAGITVTLKISNGDGRSVLLRTEGGGMLPRSVAGMPPNLYDPNTSEDIRRAIRQATR